jgi:signal transduction histidine kinase
MNESAAKLSSRVIRWAIGASLATNVLLLGLIPDLLLLAPAAQLAAINRELLMLALAGLAGFGIVAMRLERHRYVLRALALGSRSIEAYELDDFVSEPGRLTRRWLLPHVLAEAVLATWARPREVDLTTATSLALLGAIVAAAVSLVLYIVVRALFLQVMELAPPDIMREVIESAERGGRARVRILQRLRTAIATPVALVAIGAALIASSHVRRADADAREATARALGRAALELNPGVVETAGLEGAATRAAELGFSPSLSDDEKPYGVVRRDHGLTIVTTPLDAGSAELRFYGTTVPVLSVASVLLALMTVGLAAGLGGALGRAHTADLQHATDGIRLLGTEAVIRGGRLAVRPPLFQAVAELEAAIERLAERFRVFARAQERAIFAREAATRMRGLFFASVSHDLKSPLNAILGFAELVRMEPLTTGQAESLDVIARRGRELLALIETILDAARVEARQLSLVVERTKTSELFGDTFTKARDLGSDRDVEVIGEIGDGAGELVVDRVRMARALATLVLFAVRQARAAAVHVRATTDGNGFVNIEVEVPGRRGSGDLSRLLAAVSRPGVGEHRGLALGLSLSRSIVDLHKGKLSAIESSSGSPAFCVKLPLPGP